MLLLAPLLLASLLPALAPSDPSQADLEKLIQETQKRWQVPGLAVVIVRDDRAILLQGFGVRQLGKPEPVTPDTLFPLASCSKSFTSLGLAFLAHDGKLHWDDRVRQHLPYFRLKDPLADAQATLRDLACHRVGLGRHDALWYRSPLSLQERVRRVAHLELQHPFRSTFEYQTILYGATGLALEQAAGVSWSEFLKDRILTPLEMANTWPTFPGNKVENLAQPHRKKPLGVEKISRYPLEQPDPAGSIHSCVRDLEKYLRFQLGDGQWKGRQLLEEKHLREPHTPQAIIRREEFTKIMNPETNFLHYGLGWIVQDYRGKPMLLHGGAIDGFRSQLTLVPHLRLGIGILNNLDKTYMNLALTQMIVDRFLGVAGRDWNEYYQEIQTFEEKSEEERPALLRGLRHPGTKPSVPLEKLTGIYFEPAYGELEIVLEKGNLVWMWQGHRGPLMHFHYDTFLGNGELLVDAPFTFQLGALGEVNSLRALDRDFSRRKVK